MGKFTLAVAVSLLCTENTLIFAYNGQFSCSTGSGRKVTQTPILKEKNRRSFLLGSIAPIYVALLSPGIAIAEDPLFRKNPLTNKVMEQMRIIEQAEADNIQYSGELAPGTGKIKDNYAELLTPILSMLDAFNLVDSLLNQKGGPNLEEAEKILSQKRFEKIAFKKTFNLFADNIYYSDPDRANVYLGGGATPRNEQSIAYLIRNEILTQLESLQVEVSYLIKEKQSGSPVETEDLLIYSNSIVKAFDQYLDLVPPAELKRAGELLKMKQANNS